MTPEDRIAAYREFLGGKAQLAPAAGLDVEPDEVHPVLKPHQRDSVVWGVRGGRRAWFASFGLGKSLIQLESERLILSKLGGGRGLIVCPLGVRQEFARDAHLIGVETTFIRTAAEASRNGIYLTNYESVRDGKLDPRQFDVVSLDEAAILRGFGGTKTFRELMGMYEGSGAYRFVATATPSPNEYIELLAYAGFLDVMDISQAKTRFFKRDSEHADRLTLHPHMEDDFWRWLASWALFLTKPSDLGYSDEGYDLPPLNVRWHEVDSPMSPYFGEGQHKDGQGFMFRNLGLGVQDAAREKRESIGLRAARVMEAVRESQAAGDGQVVIWCDLNDEQRAIEDALEDEGITVSSLYGSQPVEDREVLLEQWRRGETTVFLSKPSMYGAGVNLQQSHRMVFAGITHKFADLIQAVHREHRFLQAHPVTVDLVYTEAERSIRETVERKWAEHDTLVARMSDIIRERGLALDALAAGMTRSIGVTRREVRGGNYLLANNDSVLETIAMNDDSIGLIVTSVPFSTQYEYSPAVEDFGHTDDNAHFWQQMDFLTPELLRVLTPGRLACIHVKDRIAPGGLTGLGFQTVQPFHAEAITHYRKHGFAYMGMITVVTDVVRENNQTYRLGWTENSKDGSKMGVGMPEYVLLFRKPPTDNARSYADVPVVKSKRDYSRARWQTDAHGFWRSDGNRPCCLRNLTGWPPRTSSRSSATTTWPASTATKITSPRPNGWKTAPTFRPGSCCYSRRPGIPRCGPMSRGCGRST
jgi:helicase-like protein